ncbi:MAG: hypothetical protein V7731_01195 [Amphritea sp.]
MMEGVVTPGKGDIAMAASRQAYLLTSLTLTFLLFITPIFPAGAEEITPDKNSATQIIADEENNIVRILIDGQEIMTIDKDGLHVNGDIEHSGTITDNNGLNTIFEDRNNK